MEDQKMPENTAKEEDFKKIKPIPIANSKKWLDRIRRSKKSAKTFKEDSERYMRMYQGDYSLRPGKKRANDAISVNFVYSYIETVTPAIFSGFPYIKVRAKPRRGQDPIAAQQAAKHMEANINYWFKELGVDEELREVLFDTFFSHAGVEVGWETEIEELEESVSPDGSMDQSSEQVVKDLAVIKDRPFIRRVEPFDLVFDPDAKNRRDCRWVAMREILTWNDFIADKKFTDKCKMKLKPQHYPIDTPTDSQGWLNRDEDRGDKEWIEIYTIYDRSYKKKYVVADGYSGFLNTEDSAGEDWNFDVTYKDDPFPYVIHDAKKDKKSPYTWGELKAFEAQIIELNRMRSAMQIHVRRSIPKYVYKQSAGSRQQISKLMNARSDEAVLMENPDDMRAFENAMIPADLMPFTELCKDDLINVSGMIEYQNESIAKTATEAQIMNGQGEVRKSAKSTRWEQFVVAIAAKLAKLCQQNQDDKIAIQISGQGGNDWLNVSKEDIEGDFMFEIEPGIMEYKSESLRMQQLLKFAEIAANNPMVNQRVIITKLAQELDMDPDEIILPADQMPPPAPPKPTIEFNKIDPTSITDPELQMAVINAAMQQNGVQQPVQQAPQQQSQINVPGNLPGMSGKDLIGGNPNGNPMLPPVSGNLTDNPLSMVK